MTPERLAQIKEHFTNPPSASCNREWALELVAEVERLASLMSAEVVETARALLSEFPSNDHAKHVAAHGELLKSVLGSSPAPMSIFDGVKAAGDSGVLTDAEILGKPTPPAAPAAKRKAVAK